MAARARRDDLLAVLAVSLGFVMATGLLHLGGIAIGLLTKWGWGRVLVRTAGGAISLAGVGFLAGVI